MIGYAVIPKENSFKDGICYTSAPDILGAGAIFQIYRTESEAKKFLKVRFGDASYKIVQVEILEKEVLNEIQR